MLETQLSVDTREVFFCLYKVLWIVFYLAISSSSFPTIEMHTKMSDTPFCPPSQKYYYFTEDSCLLSFYSRQLNRKASELYLFIIALASLFIYHLCRLEKLERHDCLTARIGIGLQEYILHHLSPTSLDAISKLCRRTNFIYN